MISGGAKAFDEILNLSRDGATIQSVSSGDFSAAFILERNRITLWKSDDSDDSTEETIVVQMDEAITFDRLFLIGHNFKEFDVMYDVASVWTAFTNVVGITGAVTGINETVFAQSVAYYEFTAVTTTRVRIRARKTQTANEEKFLNQLILTRELFTLNGFPSIQPALDRTKKTSDMLDGRTNMTEMDDIFSARVKFNCYPRSTEGKADVQNIFALNERNLPFLFWPCGGRFGNPYFSHTIRGFRLEDIYLCWIVADLDPVYENDVYNNGVTINMRLREAA